MGRLTERYENGIAVPVQELDMPLLEEVIEKLAHYEDLEEAGRLIELPCAVGDTVWEVVPLPMLFDDLKQGYTILEKEFGFNDLKDFVDWVFLTKEEAERKLKELG